MEDKQDNLFGVDMQMVYRLLLFVLVGSLAFGSISSGALSEDYSLNPIVTWIILLITSYMIIVGLMYLFGGNPSKTEVIIIPTLIIGTVLFAFNALEFNPTQEPNDIGNQPTETVDTTSEFVPTSSDPSGTVGQTITSSSEMTNSTLSEIIRLISLGFIMIIILGILAFVIYWLINRTEFDPKVSLAREINYSKSTHQSNLDIIEYYEKSSKKIEELKGRAPDWFSPTFFAEQVDESPGPPLSSYFDQLTELYELARFSNRVMNDADVKEAKELAFEIKNQVKRMHDYLEEVDQ